MGKRKTVGVIVGTPMGRRGESEFLLRISFAHQTVDEIGLVSVLELRPLELEVEIPNHVVGRTLAVDAGAD